MLKTKTTITVIGTSTIIEDKFSRAYGSDRNDLRRWSD